MQPRVIVRTIIILLKQHSIPNLRVGVFWFEWGAGDFGVQVERRRGRVGEGRRRWRTLIGESMQWPQALVRTSRSRVERGMVGRWVVRLIG